MAGGGNAIRGSRVGAGPMGEAERGEAAPRQAVTYFCSHEHRSVVTFAVEADGPGLVGLPQVRPAGQPGLGEPAAGAEDRALQDPPGLREGAPLRRRGRRHPRRGPPAAPLPPQVRRHHLLTGQLGALSGADRALGGTLRALTGQLQALSGADRALGGTLRVLTGRFSSAATAVASVPVDDACGTGARTGTIGGMRPTPTGCLPDLTLLDERCPLPLDTPFTTQQALDAGGVRGGSCASCSTGR